jgi:hypothetical protein
MKSIGYIKPLMIVVMDNTRGKPDTFFQQATAEEMAELLNN